jgi:hypothetical protein
MGSLSRAPRVPLHIKLNAGPFPTVIGVPGSGIYLCAPPRLRPPYAKVTRFTNLFLETGLATDGIVRSLSHPLSSRKTRPLPPPGRTIVSIEPDHEIIEMVGAPLQLCNFTDRV